MLTYWRELNQNENLPFAEYKYTTIATFNAKATPNDILPTLKRTSLLWYSDRSMGLPRLQIWREPNHDFQTIIAHGHKPLEAVTALLKTNTAAHLVNFNKKSFLNSDTWWQYYSIISSDLTTVPITAGQSPNKRFPTAK